MRYLLGPLDPGVDRAIYYSGIAFAAVAVLTVTAVIVIVIGGARIEAAEDPIPMDAVELSDQRGSIRYDIGADWRMDSIGLLICRGEDCRYLFLTPADGRYLEASGGAYAAARFLSSADGASPLPWAKMPTPEDADAMVVAGRIRAAKRDKTMTTQCIKRAVQELLPIIGLPPEEWDGHLGWGSRMEIVEAAAAAWGCGS
jgi:hypothetical protein